MRHSKLIRGTLALTVATQMVMLFGSQALAQPEPSVQRDLAIDVEHIALDLRFDLQSATAQGSASISLRPEIPLNVVSLDAVGLDVQRVELEGVGALEFKHTDSLGGGNLEISLDKQYTPSDLLAFRIFYSTVVKNGPDPANIWGSYGKGLRFHNASTTDQRRRPQIWSSSLPRSNRHWFPSYDRPDDLRTFEIKATVDEGLTVLSNGRLLSERANADGRKTVHWKMDKPHQNHRSSIVIGQYDNFSTESNGVKLNNYGYPDEMDGVEASVERLPDMMSFLEKTIGTKFPFPTYTQAFVQEFPWGTANAGLVTLTENFVDSKEVHRDFLYLWDDLEAESLAEQWFGNSVGIKQWEDIWLSRGLPRYLATLYNESRIGEVEVLLSPYHVPSDLQTIKNDWKNDARSSVRPAQVEDPAAFTVGNASSIRGTIFLRALEGEIGRESLLQAIRDFALRKAGKLVTTKDFERFVSKAAGRDMSWFFEQGLNRADYPHFTASHNYDPERKVLTLQIDQKPLESNANNVTPQPLFQGKMEIEVDGLIAKMDIQPNVRNTLEVASDGEPEFVNFDFKSRWLAEWDTSQTPEQLFNTAKNSNDILAKRTALISLGNLAVDEAIEDSLRSQITNLYRRVMESDDYWRLKMVAMFQLRRTVSGGGSKPKAGLDGELESALVGIIKGTIRDEAWVRFAAINWLGEARDSKYADLYLSLLRDPSDRVINAAAIALGKSGDQRAFDALVGLEPHPSWKNQSRISMLNGLAELGDARGVSIATRALKDRQGARWTLLTPVWDYRLAAANTLSRLDGTKDGVSFIGSMFNVALAENNIGDCMYNLHLMVALVAPETRVSIAKMRARFSTNQQVLDAVDAVEKQLENALK